MLGKVREWEAEGRGTEVKGGTENDSTVLD